MSLSLFGEVLANFLYRRVDAGGCQLISAGEVKQLVTEQYYHTYHLPYTLSTTGIYILYTKILYELLSQFNSDRNFYFSTDLVLVSMEHLYLKIQGNLCT